MKNIIVWYRNDLRIHDHPALTNAALDGDMVIPVFIFDPSLYKGKRASSNRNRFLLECLEDLKGSLRELGADLLIREGNPETVLRELANEVKAEAVYYTADYTPFALHRDKIVHRALESSTLALKAFPGRLIVDNIDAIKTKAGTPHKVFSPFFKVWLQTDRREISGTPKALSFPGNSEIGSLPKLEDVTLKSDLSPNVIKGGETEGLKRLHEFLHDDVTMYHENNNDLAADATSRLSSYFHFGCVSPLVAESKLSDREGEQAWQRQLAWRDFYQYVLFYNPQNSRQEYREKYRSLKWGNSEKLLDAWKQGLTGYPVVDAAMRQLASEGWMHNRARLIVGSFLTKDLWIDWRLGEHYFMQMLLDGDQANNNGNWQWIASVGVDPAPVFRRLYNPSSQRDKFDPSGTYVRKYVPELKNVPDKYLSEPWKMPPDVQEKAKCSIGNEYPKPIVDHAQARVFALEQYYSAK